METQMSVKIGTVELAVWEKIKTYYDEQIKIEIETPFDEKIWWQFVKMVATNQTITFRTSKMSQSDVEDWTCQCYIHTLACTDHNQNIIIISEVIDHNNPIQYWDENNHGYISLKIDEEPKPFLDWNKIS